ncbi:DVUA0089 family protein [Salipiger sp. IMCC34102]|uniref:DVUA0089 family protein n=1 Tax=Salipiger sp. IMCC34102 TaxID=2510647 RepID=UPI001F5DA1EB|nr:DVUA0089 family protein [Salipiger sp. IMCC34102]
MIRLSALAALAMTASPLAAQTSPCSGTGSDGQWIGGSEAGSDIATLEGYAEQMALVLGGNEYASLFTLSEDTPTRIEAQGRGNGDPVMTLYDAEGTEVASDDDSGGNGAARAELDLAAGAYCAVVRSFDDSPMTAFVRIARTDQEPLTAGMDTTTEPEPVAESSCDTALDMGTFTGEPLSQDAVPAESAWLAFDLAEPGGFTVTARNESADPTLRIESSAGALLGENDDYDGLNSRVDVTASQDAGRYCVALGALSDTSLPITVEVAAYDPSAAVADLYARGEAAPPLDGSVEITDLGTLDGLQRLDRPITDRASWFSVNIPERGVILAEALSIGPDGDPWLVIFDERGRQVAQNDDTPPGTDAQIASRIDAGTYLIGVKQVAGGTGFVRLLLERYIPAQ